MAVWIKIVVLRFPCGIESKIYSFLGGKINRWKPLAIFAKRSILEV